MKEVFVLCSVIDNFGDIGFVYRLLRRLSEINKSRMNIRLAINGIQVFSKICPQINSNLPSQMWNEICVLDWTNSKICAESLKNNPPQIVLQCFQCERPQWFEDVVFSDEWKSEIKIINVEYLTAESWADDFHLLKSGTRKINVKKVNFMPGFTAKTGGLVLDKKFMEARNQKSENKNFNILMFSYEKNFDFFVQAVNQFAEKNNRQITIHVAQGAGFSSFMEYAQNFSSLVQIVELPYLEQTEWDKMLCSMDFLFIRGEDSFSRAALSSIPFVWHAYIQDEEFQLVKVNAILERMEPFFEKNLFSCLKDFFIRYNKSTSQAGSEALEILEKFTPLNCSESELLLNLLEHHSELKKSFNNFSENLIQNGDLGEHLVEYIFNGAPA